MTEALGERYEVLPEPPPGGEHQRNGVIERAVDSVCGMARTLRASVEGDTGHALDDNDSVVPRTIKHAAVLLTLYYPFVDGMSAYQRSRGKAYKRALPRMADRVFFLPLDRERGQKRKLADKWLPGVFLGVKMGMNELFPGRPDGQVVRAAADKRRPGTERFSAS